ncbi:MAG: serine protease [Patescibacteria group bacterium]
MINEGDGEKKDWLSLNISLRTGLLMLLIASVMTFLGQVAVSAIAYYGYTGRQDVGEAEFEYQQTKLEMRVQKLEAVREAERELLGERLTELSGSEPTSREIVVNDQHGSSFSIESLMGSVVEIICLDNTNKDVFYTGSGTIVDPNGLVMTNQHLLVSKDGSMIQFCGVGFTTNIEQPPTIEFIAEFTATDHELDLAILEIVENMDGKEMPLVFPALSLEGVTHAAQSLKLGDEIYIAGYPGIGAETFTFTQGVVSGRVGKNLIKTSALIDSGTSGGAAFDGNGNYVGLPTAAARGDIGGSLGYLIAGDIVDTFLTRFYAGELNNSTGF